MSSLALNILTDFLMAHGFVQAKRDCKGDKLLCSSIFLQGWCTDFENCLQDRGQGAEHIVHLAAKADEKNAVLAFCDTKLPALPTVWSHFGKG